MSDDYFERIETDLASAIEVAETARGRGADPEPTVEIPVATDMADRVENLLGIDGLADRIRELESEMDREAAALALARDFADGSVGSYESNAGKIEGAVRSAVALLTEGVVAAPIEGIDRVEVDANDDGSEFVRVYYAGPIRSAGGTAQALSVLVADYARALLGLAAYAPRDDEVERYVEEIGLYDDETGLQYSPSDEETRFIARHCPIMLDGEPTGEGDVSGFRDLERVGTNATRGGLCLVLAEGIALKAPKIQRYTRNLDPVEWPWLASLIDGSFKSDSSVAAEQATEIGESADAPGPGTEASTDTAGPPRPPSSDKFLRDLIAGRPVFSHPSRAGGFRLRYGRARNHGFATAGIHPATMHLLDDFLATGTQIKTERPGKAAGVVPVDSIEGPTVRLATGEVRRIDDPATALELRNGVEEIIDVGEYLVNFGEFVENNQALAPAGFTVEWWTQAFERAGGDVQALADDPHVDLEAPTPEVAIEWATSVDAPLHPRHTYCWHDISIDDFQQLGAAISGATMVDDCLEVPRSDAVVRVLETLLVEHRQASDRILVDRPAALVRSLGMRIEDGEVRGAPPTPSSEASAWPNAMRAVNEAAPFEIYERAPTRIGIRMGRPEKSEHRELSPAVHTLFPIGDAGGDQRDVMAATREAGGREAAAGTVEVDLGRRQCDACGTETFRARCPECSDRTTLAYECVSCETPVDPDPETGRVQCDRCDRPGSSVREWQVPLDEIVEDALDTVSERESAFDILKGVKGLTSADKTPEPIEKGILRAKHGVSVFKDGTIRYDMTDLPVTAVTPAELDVDAETFRDLGYESGIDGEPLRHDDQLVALRVQDIVLSDGAAEHLLRTADFVDDLLERYYDLEPFYTVSDRSDLVGELVFGMAPHTSAAVVGRIVGFTRAPVGYAHPYFHAAKRRNCDGDEDCVMLLLDGLLNFSERFLPDKRGGKMDAPLVMSSRIDPAEIDDEAHNMDIVDEYPLEFYEATREMADPETVDIRTAESTVGTEAEYDPFPFTHDTTNIALGPAQSAYKTLGPMMDKMDAQLELARIIRAVDETDVAERVIEYHFLPDLIGNLRAFGSQETRCHGCGSKFRRMPLSETCPVCGGTVNLTVHEGSVTKYLDSAIRVAEEYGCREYTKQRLSILELRIESIFENDKNKQSGIADFM